MFAGRFRDGLRHLYLRVHMSMSSLNKLVLYPAAAKPTCSCPEADPGGTGNGEEILMHVVGYQDYAATSQKHAVSACYLLHYTVAESRRVCISDFISTGTQLSDSAD